MASIVDVRWNTDVILLGASHTLGFQHMLYSTYVICPL